MHPQYKSSPAKKTGVLTPILIVVGVVVLVAFAIGVYLATITLFNKVVSPEGTGGNQGAAIAPTPESMFEIRDRDKSGLLEQNELVDLWEDLKPFDADGDGALSIEEYIKGRKEIGGW